MHYSECPPQRHAKASSITDDRNVRELTPWTQVTFPAKFARQCFYSLRRRVIFRRVKNVGKKIERTTATSIWQTATASQLIAKRGSEASGNSYRFRGSSDGYSCTAGYLRQ